MKNSRARWRTGRFAAASARHWISDSTRRPGAWPRICSPRNTPSWPTRVEKCLTTIILPLGIIIVAVQRRSDSGTDQPHSGKVVQASCLLGQFARSPGVLEVSSTEVLIHLFPGGSYGSEFKRSVSQTLETINQRQLEHPKLPSRRFRFRLAHRSEFDPKVRIGT